MNLNSNRLLTSILAAGALLLGACVAETGDDEDAPVATSVSADTYTPMLPKDPGGKQSSGKGTPTRSRAKSTSSDNGATLCADPEPSPWRDPPSH
jgi:hypothetical protein